MEYNVGERDQFIQLSEASPFKHPVRKNTPPRCLDFIKGHPVFFIWSKAQPHSNTKRVVTAVVNNIDPDDYEIEFAGIANESVAYTECQRRKFGNIIPIRIGVSLNIPNVNATTIAVAQKYVWELTRLNDRNGTVLIGNAVGRQLPRIRPWKDTDTLKRVMFVHRGAKSRGHFAAIIT